MIQRHNLPGTSQELAMISKATFTITLLITIQSTWKQKVHNFKITSTQLLHKNMKHKSVKDSQEMGYGSRILCGGGDDPGKRRWRQHTFLSNFQTQNESVRDTTKPGSVRISKCPPLLMALLVKTKRDPPPIHGSEAQKRSFSLMCTEA